MDLDVSEDVQDIVDQDVEEDLHVPVEDVWEDIEERVPIKDFLTI